MEQTTNTTKKKKVLTKKSIVQKKYLFKTLMYVGLFMPMFILACVKFDEYFATNKDSFSVAAGGFLIAIFTGLLAKVGIKNLHKLISASFFVAIVWCLSSIFRDFLLISSMFWLGIAIYSIFEIPANYYTKILDTWTDEEIRQTIRTQNTSEEDTSVGDEYGQI